MDKQAFKQRMRNLKSYRENNPGKGYWDWKVQTLLALDEEYSIGRADTDPVDDYRRYAISLNADEVPTQAHVRHELGHLTDIMQNDGMLHTDIDNNKITIGIV